MSPFCDVAFGCCGRYEQEDMLPEHQRGRGDSEPFLQQEQRLVDNGVSVRVGQFQLAEVQDDTHRVSVISREVEGMLRCCGLGRFGTGSDWN